MEPSKDFDSKQLRNTVGCFATGVTVITARDEEGQPVGLTANSFTSVSLEPPLLLFSLGKSAGSFSAFGPQAPFAVHILGADQESLSSRFATPAPDKFAGLPTERWQTGVPILPGCLAVLECETHARHDAGDHVIVVGRVLQLAATGRGDPLLFFGGRYAAIA